jgi:hypothetical protein
MVRASPAFNTLQVFWIYRMIPWKDLATAVGITVANVCLHSFPRQLHGLVAFVAQHDCVAAGLPSASIVRWNQYTAAGKSGKQDDQDEFHGASAL